MNAKENRHVSDEEGLYLGIAGWAAIVGLLYLGAESIWQHYGGSDRLINVFIFAVIHLTLSILLGWIGNVIRLFIRPDFVMVPGGTYSALRLFQARLFWQSGDRKSVV